MQSLVSESSPWYRHPWVWFIVLLLGVSVIGSLYTVSIAYSLGDIENLGEIEVTSETARSMDEIGFGVAPVSRSQER